MPFKKKTDETKSTQFDQTKRARQPNARPAYGERKDPMSYKQSHHPFLSIVKARALRKAQKEQNIKEVTWILLDGTLGEIARGLTPTLGQQFVKTATQQLIKLQDIEEAYERKMQKAIEDAAARPEDEDELAEWLSEDEEEEDEY